MIPKEIVDSLSDYFLQSGQTSSKIISTSSLSGGCINHVSRIVTNDAEYCIKYNLRSRFPEMFVAEADGLACLRKAGEIRVPEVIYTGTAGVYDYILLEFITSGKKTGSFMEIFGHGLARLHKHSNGYFGHYRDNYMGSLPQSNAGHQDWSSFYCEERLKKQVSLASAHFSSSGLSAFDRLYSALDDLIPGEPPALLHGDLWGGNYMVAPDGGPCLIDPAVYYGHREVDIAMTTLFGGFDERFYSAYQEEYPLEDGWKKRIDIFRLYPLLIHLNLFGRAYLNSVLEIMEKF